MPEDVHQAPEEAQMSEDKAPEEAHTHRSASRTVPDLVKVPPIQIIKDVKELILVILDVLILQIEGDLQQGVIFKFVI